MKLSDLVLHVGDEHVAIQPITQAMVKAEYKKRDNCVDITFSTKAITVDELMGRSPKMLGIVAWFPVDRLPEHLRPTKQSAAEGELDKPKH